MFTSHKENASDLVETESQAIHNPRDPKENKITGNKVKNQKLICIYNENS